MGNRRVASIAFSRAEDVRHSHKTTWSEYAMIEREAKEVCLPLVRRPPAHERLTAMIRYCCDGCGKMMSANDVHRYIVRVEVFAAAEGLTISEEELARDHKAEIERIVSDLKQADPDQIEDEVYRSFRFDLCSACQRRYLANPLAALTPVQ